MNSCTRAVWCEHVDQPGGGGYSYGGASWTKQVLLTFNLISLFNHHFAPHELEAKITGN